VFCDLRGYTAFTETAEPEEVLDFLREYHGALGPLVSQFEGTLDQFSGDGARPGIYVHTCSQQRVAQAGMCANPAIGPDYHTASDYLGRSEANSDQGVLSPRCSAIP
jgi:class 3 adenylate cyclase